MKNSSLFFGVDPISAICLEVSDYRRTNDATESGWAHFIVGENRRRRR